MLEKRTYNFDISADTNDAGEKIITGRPIVYDSMTDLGLFNEIIDRGALDNTDLTDVRFLVNHNTDMIPLARSRRNNGNSTMKITTDNDGLSLDFVKLDVENNSDARALYSAIQRGDISGMSFMFYVDGEAWENLDSDHPTRHRTSIGSVVEVSAVTFPAYTSTEIYARSEAAVLENTKQALEKARAENRAALVDTNELELLKAKAKILGGF